MENWKIKFANKETKKMEHHSPAYYVDLFERYEKEKEKQVDKELEQFKRYLDKAYNSANDNEKDIINLICDKIEGGKENTFEWRKEKYLDSFNDCIDWDWLEEIEKELGEK